jgi:phosphomannomutase/phosphoglucomutase
MSELKSIVLNGDYETRTGGRYIFVHDMAERYVKSLTNRS